MVLLNKKNLPASMDKSTLPDALFLKISEDGKSIPIMPVALLGRDDDNVGVLTFAETDGSLLTKRRFKEDSQSITGAAQESASVDISNYTSGSIEIDLTACTTAGTAQLRISNDNSNWKDGDTPVITISTGDNTYHQAIADDDMKFKYIQINYVTVVGMVSTQIIVVKG